MSPRNRKHKKHLPTRMYFNKGFYWFVKPDGKWIKLGKQEKESLKAYAEIISEGFAKNTMQPVFDRYEKEVIPTKAKSTQRNNLREIRLLGLTFGKMHPMKIKPHHIAQYLDHRANVAGNREIALLSHVFKKAMRWGVVDKNPCEGVERLSETSQEVYIDSEQYNLAYADANDRIRLVMEIGRITGLRQGDILRLKWSDLTNEGLLVKNQKTGKKQLFLYSKRLVELLEAAKELKSQIASVYIIKDQKGQPWTSSGFQTAWQRLMSGKAYRFKFKDIRAKAASEAGSLENAKELLNHSDSRVTQKHYFNVPKRVKPNE